MHVNRITEILRVIQPSLRTTTASEHSIEFAFQGVAAERVKAHPIGRGRSGGGWCEAESSLSRHRRIKSNYRRTIHGIYLLGRIKKKKRVVSRRGHVKLHNKHSDTRSLGGRVEERKCAREGEINLGGVR